MLTLFLMMIHAQVTFEQKASIRLNVEAFDFDKITVTNQNILICDETQQIVHVFDLKGSLVGSLGSDDTIQLPSEVSWIKEKQQFYVYDASKREFTIWDANSFKYAGKINTDFDLFFEVGPLQPLTNGFAASVSLVDKKYLVGRYDEQFTQGTFKFELANAELKDMSPVLREAHLIRLDLYSGTRLVAAQAMSPEVRVYDEALGMTDIIPLKVPGWRVPNYKKLRKVSKNPHELNKLRKSFSEIVDLMPMTGSTFLVGFRNVRGDSGYSYQMYDATTAQASGAPFSSSYRSIGGGTNAFYLRSPDDKMALIPVAF